MLQSIKNFSSYVQCKWLNVWSVYFYFSRGYGSVQNSSGNFGGVGGGYFSGQKTEILGRREAYVKFPPWWGYGYFLELHNKLKMEPNQIQSTKLGVYLSHPAL